MFNSKFKTVIFDMDGTLLNTLSDITDAGNHTLEKMSLKPYTELEFKNFIGGGVQRLIKKMLPENSSEAEIKKAQENFSVYYDKIKFNKTAVYPGLTELLRKLCSCGIKTGIITNKPHNFACEMTELYLNGFITLTYGARDNIPKKPSPFSLFEIMSVFNVESNEVLFVGDSGIDMQTAKNANVISCGVLWGYGGKDEIIKNGADYLIKTADELYDVIFSY